MKARRLKNGRSLHTLILIGLLAFTGVLLLFMSVALVPFISQLLSENAIERTNETVLQSVNVVDQYVETTLSTLHFATSLIPVNPETPAAR